MNDRGPAHSKESQHNWPCITCGYDLHGLPVDGRCPECGEPIERSLTTDELKHADPAWLRDLSRGCILLLTSAVLFIIGLLCPFLFLMFMDNQALAQIVDYLVYVSWGGGFMLLIVGMFLITVQEPRDVLTEGDISNRLLARSCALIAAVSFGLGKALQAPWVHFARFGFLGFLILGMVASLYRLRLLASRIPDARLATLARRSTTRIATLGGLIAASWLVDVFTEFNVPRVVNAVLWIFLLLATLRALALFGRFRNAVVAALEPGRGSPVS